MAERKQVNLGLGKVSATPSIQAVGGTKQAVAPSVLRDNSAMRLSRSLAQFSNILGQASNINMQRGQDEAEKLSSQEINDIIEGKVPAPDGGPLGKLGFQKAFQQMAAKRWFDTTGVKKYADLENKLDAKMDEFIKSSMPIEKVQAYVQNEVNALDQEINKYFEGNTFGSRVKNLLGSELSARVTAGATKGYEKKQLAYMNAVADEKLRNIFGDVGAAESEMSLKGLMAYAEKDLSERNYSNLQKQKIITDNFADLLNSIIKTNPERAGDFIDQARGFKQFKTMDGRMMLNKFTTTLESISDVEDEKSASQSAMNIGGFASEFLREANSYRVSDDPNKLPFEQNETANNALDLILSELELDDDTKFAYKKAIMISGDPLKEITKQLTAIARERRTSSFAVDVIGRSIRGINNERFTLLQSPDDRSIGITQAQRAVIKEEALAWFLQRDTTNPLVNEQAFLKEKGIQGKAPLSLTEAYGQAIKFDPFINKKDINLKISGKLNQILGTAGDLKDYYSAEQIKQLTNSTTDAIIRSLKTRGFEIAPEGESVGEENINELKKAFSEIIEEEVKETTDLFDARVQALRINRNQLGLDFGFSPNIEEIVTENIFSEKDLSEDGLFYEDGGTPFNFAENKELVNYESLYRSSVTKVVEAKKTNEDYSKFTTEEGNNLGEEIQNDFSEARSKRDTKALKLLQQVYGYDQFDKSNILNDFAITGLWWDSVKLFGSVDEARQTYTEFAKVIEAYSNRKQLTEEQNRTLNVLQGLGLFQTSIEGESAIALETFYEVQTRFLPNK
jgi:hypothetical protein